MKKIVSFILLIGLVVTFSACTDTNNEITPSESPTIETTPSEAPTPESTVSQITMQEAYDSCKNLDALLGNHENVFVQVASNGTVLREAYWDKQYYYSFYGAEYMDIGFDSTSLLTGNAEYVYSENIYLQWLYMAPSGMVDITGSLALAGTMIFVSTEILDEDTTYTTDENGCIIITCTFEQEEVETMGENIVSCVETYTLDATTREVSTIKTVYTYEDGTLEEGTVTITRDVETPEKMKPFLKYAQETENMRTVTIVSNPGTENEKTDSIQIPKGLNFGLSVDFDIEGTFTLYADAACTQTIEQDFDVNSDHTIYVKWDE